jgi:hypothetical protein
MSDMFDHDISLLGKHATYTKYLVKEARLYERNIDVYMNGAVFGLLYNRTAPIDRESNDSTNILTEVLTKSRADLMFLYRLVMLLEQTTDLEAPERIDRAFRDDANDDEPEKLKKNMELFDSYVLGGIEQMYEDFVEKAPANAPEDYLERAMDVMQRFYDDLSGNAPQIDLKNLG